MVAYYPGAYSSSDGEPLTVRAGEEISASITLARTSLASILGTVRRLDGRPLNGSSVSAEPIGNPRSGPVPNASARILPDGSYALSSLPPGDYIVSATTTGTYDANLRDITQDRLFASVRVPLNGNDVRVPLILTKGSTALGRYVFDTGAPPSEPAPPSGVSALTPMTLPQLVSPRVTVLPDWTFEITQLLGTYRLRSLRAPSGWFIKAITMNGTDVTYAPVDFTGQVVEGVEVLLTQRATRVTVTVSGEAQLQDASVIFFPEDESRLWPDTPFLRTYRNGIAARLPSSDTFQRHTPQSFTAIGLPPGRYYAVTVANLDGDGTDPEELRRLRTVATRVDLTENEAKSVELKVTAAQ